MHYMQSLSLATSGGRYCLEIPCNRDTFWRFDRCSTPSWFIIFSIHCKFTNYIRMWRQELYLTLWMALLCICLILELKSIKSYGVRFITYQNVCMFTTLWLCTFSPRIMIIACPAVVKCSLFKMSMIIIPAMLVQSYTADNSVLHPLTLNAFIQAGVEFCRVDAHTLTKSNP